MTASMVSQIARGGRNAKVSLNFEVEMISPRRAAELLAANTANRKIRRAVVERYARDMAAGRWNFDGSPIRFSKGGELIDGQHRLTALIESGVTLPFVVIYDLALEVRDSIDTGAGRSAGDVLQFNGYADSYATAAIARVVMTRESGWTSTSGKQVSNIAVHQWVEANPQVAAAVEVYHAARRAVPASPSVVAAAFFLCAAINEDAASDFFITRLIRIEGLTSDDPARVVRSKLAQINGRDSHAVKFEQLRFLILAWNADRAGKKIQQLRTPVGGWTRSNFPEPI